jgi:hypothetical protein
MFTSAIHTVAFFIPGTSQIYITKSGQFTLWTTFNKFNAPPREVRDLQDIKLTFVDLSTQEARTFITQIDWKDQKNQIYHYSLGSFNFTHPGNYQVTALAHSNLPPYKVYLRQPSLTKVIHTVGWSIFLTLFSMATAVLFAVIVLTKRINMCNLSEN